MNRVELLVHADEACLNDDTDYILVKSDVADAAQKVWQQSGVVFVRPIAQCALANRLELKLFATRRRGAHEVALTTG